MGKKKNRKDNVNDYEKVYILDTNIILNDANNVFKISENGENLIVLPETVIDEIDSKKGLAFEEIGYEARNFARMLTKSSNNEVYRIKTKEKNEMLVSKFYVGNDTEIEIVGLDSYKKYFESEKSILNDRKILEVAEAYAREFKDTQVIFLTLDVMCFVRAMSLGIEAQLMNNKGEENFKPEFNKNIELKVRKMPQDMSIEKFDPEYQVGNYFYKIKSGNSTMLGYVKNEKLELINRNSMKFGTIKMKNEEQEGAFAIMTDPDIDIVVIEALAGSGKTLISILAGMNMINRGVYDKIVYIRNSIESLDKGEDVGALSGNDEKFMVYNHPLYDTLSFIADMQKKSSNVEHLKSQYDIQTLWIGEARGRTIRNAFVIIDEIQNFSKKSLQTILSRIDEGSKVVCIGSNRQIDNPYVNKFTNGLSLLISQLSKPQELVTMAAIDLKRVERGRITEWTERIFSEDRNRQ